MSEKDLKILDVKREININDSAIRGAQHNAGACNAYISNYKKRLVQIAADYELVKADFEAKLKRQIENAQVTQDILEGLLEEKEVLHVRLKEAIHYGEVQCEHCNKYYTAQGLARHQATCSMKPQVKKVKKKEKQIKVDKEALANQKAQLEAEIADLEQKKKNIGQ
ncbi:MAG: hypothetical protein GY834_02335 [Bacteroidetes bacterium]|nr:hypothetical protein [Bacteroidota bacterium]